jgi:2-phosphoglycerate kinase
VITVEDEDLHRSHFSARGTDVASRPYERYLKGFPKIRRIQKYIKSQALSHNVPVIPNYSLDQALAAVIDLVVERATDRLRQDAQRRHPVRRPSELEASTR